MPKRHLRISTPATMAFRIRNCRGGAAPASWLRGIGRAACIRRSPESVAKLLLNSGLHIEHARWKKWLHVHRPPEGVPLHGVSLSAARLNCGEACPVSTALSSKEASTKDCTQAGGVLRAHRCTERWADVSKQALAPPECRAYHKLASLPGHVLPRSCHTRCARQSVWVSLQIVYLPTSATLSAL
jgi:hypothetical protein